jgi:hypothetical protein
VLAKRTRLTIAQQVIAAEGDWVKAHVTRHHVQHRLHGKGELRGPRRPCVTPRYLIGVDALGHHSDDWYVVAGSRPSTKIDVRTEGTVGSAVEDGVDVHRLQAAVTAHPYSHADH